MTSAHPWTSTRIFSKMCVHLAKQGHDVLLVAVDPEGKHEQVFRTEGVEVHLRPGVSYRGRLARSTVLAGDVIRHAAELSADVYQLHDPELIPFAALFLPRDAQVIFDAHEDFVSQMDSKTWATGIRRVILKSGLRAVRTIARCRMDHVIAATSGVRKDYDRAHSTVVRNLPILSEINVGERSVLTERPAEVCYIGAISEVRGILQTLEAIDICDRVEVLHLAGRFASPALRARCEAMPGWRKVRYHGFIGREEIVEILGRVRAGLVTLHATQNHLHAIPIKLLEYLCAGVPAITSDFPYWHEFVKDGQTARFVDPMDPAVISAALDIAMSDDGASIFEAHMTDEARNAFSWEEEVKILENVYRRCIEQA